MSRFGRSPEEIKLEIAHAVGTDQDILEALRQGQEGGR